MTKVTMMGIARAWLGLIDIANRGDAELSPGEMATAPAQDQSTDQEQA